MSKVFRPINLRKKIEIDGCFVSFTNINNNPNYNPMSDTLVSELEAYFKDRMSLDTINSGYIRNVLTAEKCQSCGRCTLLRKIKRTSLPYILKWLTKFGYYVCSCCYYPHISDSREDLIAIKKYLIRIKGVNKRDAVRYAADIVFSGIFSGTLRNTIKEFYQALSNILIHSKEYENVKNQLYDRCGDSCKITITIPHFKSNHNFLRGGLLHMSYEKKIRIKKFYDIIFNNKNMHEKDIVITTDITISKFDNKSYNKSHHKSLCNYNPKEDRYKTDYNYIDTYNIINLVTVLNESNVEYIIGI